MCHICLKVGGGHVHCGRSEGAVGRAADCGAWRGRNGTHQHCSHQCASAQAAVFSGGEVLPSTAERHFRAGEQVRVRLPIVIIIIIIIMTDLIIQVT